MIVVSPTGGYEFNQALEAKGLLRTKENLFVTGLVGGSVVASRLANNLALEATREWRTPSKAAIAMNGPLSVFDERILHSERPVGPGQKTPSASCPCLLLTPSIPTRPRAQAG